MTSGTDFEITFSVDERSIVLYLYMKGFSARAIRQEFREMLGSEAVAYFTLMWDLGTAAFPRRNEDAPIEAEPRRTDRADTITVNGPCRQSFFAWVQALRIDLRYHLSN
jgi:hypothetical protein